MSVSIAHILAFWSVVLAAFLTVTTAFAGALAINRVA